MKLGLAGDIASRLYARGEEFINDAGVDPKVCDEVAFEICGSLCMDKLLDPLTVRIADLVYDHCNKHGTPIPDILPERIKSIFLFGKDINGPKH